MLNDVKVVIHKKKRSNGEYPIMLRISHEKGYKYISVGATILQKDWDSKREKPKKSYPLYQEVSILIDKARLSASKDV